MADVQHERLEIGHVLFLDIVGYSRLLIEEQKELLRRLTEIVLSTEQVREVENEQLIRLPTGDGMALVFRNSAEEPARCALEIARALKADTTLLLRMGIHSGPVSEVIDVNGRTNIAGPGINMAQRVMDCGDAGHILLSARVADDLEQFTRWKPHIHELGECEVKHGARIRVANLYTEEAGNSALPRKFRNARRQHGARAIGVTLLVLILAAGAAILFHRSSIEDAAGAEKSIAVLPFANLSEEKANAYFAAGVQDEILTRLANLPQLKVIARTSTEKYESHPEDLRKVGAELGVAHLLEGSVQKLGKAVHVNVQLIKASNAAHVWAQSYDRTLEDVFAVQGEVAQTVANALKIALLPDEIERLKALPTRNPDAHDAYLRGEYAFQEARKNPGDYQSAFEPAIAAFQEAVTADPNFALAYAHLAYAELIKEEWAHLDGRTTHKPELLVSAKQNIDRALQLAPDLPMAHLALGRWHLAALQDRAAAVREYRRALELDPNLSEATAKIASTLLTQGRSEEAIELYLKALKSDPRNIQLLRNLGIAYTMRREYKKAREIDTRIVAMDQVNETDTSNLCYDIVQSTGDLAAARAVLENLKAHLPAGKANGARITTTELALLTYSRDFAAARSFAEQIPIENWETDWARPIVLGDLARHLGEEETARASYQNARVLLLSALAKTPDEPQLHADLASVNASLGLGDEALQEARRAIELEPVARSARAGMAWLVNLAAVEAKLGRTNDAIQGIEQLLMMPNSGDAISPWQLKLDPAWDPLRKDSRFQELLDRYLPEE